MNRLTFPALALAAFMSAGTASAATLAETYSSFWVLGDSTSDPGNLNRLSGGTFAAPPYFEGRFSNGPVWADYITQEFVDAGLPTVNFSFGNARATPDSDGIPDLPDQLDLFPSFSAGLLGARPLGVVFFGANDLYAAVESADPVGVAEQAANDIRAGVAELAAMGVSDIVVANTADISLTPRQSLFGIGDPVLGREVSLAFNAALTAPLPDLSAVGNPTITLFDFFALGEAVAADPDAFGVTNLTEPCYFDDPAVAASFGAPQICADPDRYLFWDAVHPTARAHEVMADTFRRTLGATPPVAPVPLPGAVGFLLAGMLAFGVIRRRA